MTKSSENKKWRVRLVRTVSKKITKIDKNARKLVVCYARLGWSYMYISNRYMLQKPNVWQVKLT